MDAIAGEHITFSYTYPDSGDEVLHDVSLSVRAGEFIAVLGANGSGKSTLLKHCNAILPLQNGNLRVLHLDAADADSLWELRRLCGMVFQNPDNQFVSPILEEDTAFALRNYDVPEEEIPDKVHAALSLVGLNGLERRSPHSLSGGQKQRAAIAGVLAMNPQILIFDEATAMLDPPGRVEVLECLKKLHRTGRTVIMITHFVEEAVYADRVILMRHGRILRTGTPREILCDCALLAEADLLPPTAVRLYEDLLARGIHLPRCPLTSEELVEEICRLK